MSERRQRIDSRRLTARLLSRWAVIAVLCMLGCAGQSGEADGGTGPPAAARVPFKRGICLWPSSHAPSYPTEALLSSDATL